MLDLRNHSFDIRLNFVVLALVYYSLHEAVLFELGILFHLLVAVFHFICSILPLFKPMLVQVVSLFNFDLLVLLQAVLFYELLAYYGWNPVADLLVDI
jgi:hypothetical protein